MICKVANISLDLSLGMNPPSGLKACPSLCVCCNGVCCIIPYYKFNGPSIYMQRSEPGPVETSPDKSDTAPKRVSLVYVKGSHDLRVSCSRFQFIEDVDSLMSHSLRSDA